MIKIIPRRTMWTLRQSPRAMVTSKLRVNDRLSPQEPSQIQVRTLLRLNQCNQFLHSSSNQILITRSLTASAYLQNETATIASNTVNAPYIPDVPAAGLDQTLNAIGEPTLSSLGLCSWWPSGWVQSLLETLHVTAGLDWWQSIIVYAIDLLDTNMGIVALSMDQSLPQYQRYFSFDLLRSMRLVTLPLLILAQKWQIEQAPRVVESGKLTAQLKEAQNSGDKMQEAVKGYRLQELMDGPQKPQFLKMYIGPIYQGCVMLTTFAAMRKMCNVPVESMATGGIAWFQDLLVPDPYLILPILTSVTLLINFELGIDGPKAQVVTQTVKNLVRGGIVLLPLFLMTRPNGMCLYWCVSNILGMILMRIISTRRVRNIVGIPEPSEKPALHEKNKPNSSTITEKLKYTMKSYKGKLSAADLEIANAKKFKEAGRQKPRKTYKYDPTKVKSVSS